MDEAHIWLCALSTRFPTPLAYLTCIYLGCSIPHVHLPHASGSASTASRFEMISGWDMQALSIPMKKTNFRFTSRSRHVICDWDKLFLKRGRDHALSLPLQLMIHISIAHAPDHPFLLHSLVVRKAIPPPSQPNHDLLLTQVIPHDNPPPDPPSLQYRKTARPSSAVHTTP